MPPRDIHTLLDDLMFGEGPRWHEGALWFSDMHAHEVVRVELEGGRPDTVVHVPNRPSGLGFDLDGRLLIVSMNDRKLLRHTDAGLEEVADMSALAGGPCNDMVVDAKGRAYVGNFGFDTFAGAPQQDTVLILVTPEGEVRAVADGLSFPNGTVVTPDGKTLIVGESRGLRLTAFDIEDDGSLSNRRLWADLGVSADGIALDEEGCIWVASPRGPGFIRVAEGGEIKETIESDMLAIACALGGEDRRTLFLLEAKEANPQNIEGRGNARIRHTRVEVAGAGIP